MLSMLADLRESDKVENAMSIFRDGDEVQLDGFTGEVKIIKSEL